MSACTNWKITRMWLLYLLFIVMEIFSILYLFPLILELPVYIICMIVSSTRLLVIFVLLLGSSILNSKMFELGIKLHKIHSIATPIAGVIAFPLRLGLAEPFAVGTEMIFLFMYFFWSIMPNIFCHKGNIKADHEIWCLAKIRARYNSQSSILIKKDKRSRASSIESHGPIHTPMVRASNEPTYTPVVQSSDEPAQGLPLLQEINEPVRGVQMIYTSYEPVESTSIIQNNYEPMGGVPVIQASNEQDQVQASYEPIGDNYWPEQAVQHVEADVNISVSDDGHYKNNYK
jgi:hypothetical protein